LCHTRRPALRRAALPDDLARPTLGEPLVVHQHQDRLAPPGLPISRRDLLERVDLELLVRDDALQLQVLALELLQALDVVGLHRAALGAPAVKRVLGDLELLGDLGIGMPSASIGSASRSLRTTCPGVCRRRFI
jgi:hypothetical protein